MQKKIGIKFLQILFITCVAFLAVRAVFFLPIVKFTRLATHVQLDRPTHMRFFPGDHEKVSVCEKRGLIKWLILDQGGSSGVLLDISKSVYSQGHEEGLLSMAFHPRYRENHWIYVFYSLENPKRSRVSRFTIKSTIDAEVTASEVVLLEIPKPDDTHNGGLVEFDAQGFLYVSVGDGTWTRQNPGLLQTRTTLYASILRLKVGEAPSDPPYTIPDDNPFVGEGEQIKKEIWAYGLRNAWRFSFTPSGSIIAGDVGEFAREEIDLVEKGKNYGWPSVEGDVCSTLATSADCQKPEFTKPLAVFNRKHLRSIVGGFIYRGKNFPEYEGKYIFADYMRGLFAIKLNDGLQTDMQQTLYLKPQTTAGPNRGKTMLISSLAEDNSGEIYAVNIEGGIYRVDKQNFFDVVRAYFLTWFNFR